MTSPTRRPPPLADHLSAAGPRPPREGQSDPPRRSATADRERSVDLDLDTVDWETCLTDLGRALRKLRESVGLSQRELARVSGVSQGAVSRFEAGRRRGIPGHVMLKIAVALARYPDGRDQPLAQAVRELLAALLTLVREARS